MLLISMASSKLLRITTHEALNQFDVSLTQAFHRHEPKLKPPFRLPFPAQHEYMELNMALLYAVLTEPHLAKTRIKYLHAIVAHDGYGLFTRLVVKVVNELYSKLVDSAKAQLILVAKELVKVKSVGVDGLLVSLLRQLVGSDFGDGNLWLCYELVSLFSSNWDWLVGEESFVLASALFTYLRVLGDHCKIPPSNVKLEALKRMEIVFCVGVFREHFHLCLKIGRDLIRLLQDLVHVPEFQAILKDLMLNPTAFNTLGFSGISQLYQTRTSSRYILLRITPEMETQLRFLLTYVKFGSHKRYQIWFERKFLCRPESNTLISDIVRFICCAHHPSNDIIQSDIVQRWAVVGWLLSRCKKHVEANVKLALFYDWLFFNERVDNIMNIEPAMLLMVHSIPKYIDFTHSLLEFLLELVNNYDVERRHVITRGVFSAFSLLSTKGVVQSLDVLACCKTLSPLLKERLVLFLKAGAYENLLATQVSDRSATPLSLPNAPLTEMGKSLRSGRESPLVSRNGEGGPLVCSTVGEARKRTKRT